MRRSESIIKIAPALLEAQKNIGAAKKGATNPFFHSSYADLGSVMEACKEALNEQGISILQPISSDEQGVYVETILLHESGEYITDLMRISVKSENDPQAQGSAITYARRYSLQSMVFIPAEDDDAEKATDRKITTPPITNFDTKHATPKQVSLISVLLNQKGQSDYDLKAKYKVESKKDLTMQQASTIIENLNKLPDKPKEFSDEELEEIDKGINEK